MASSFRRLIWLASDERELQKFRKGRACFFHEIDQRIPTTVDGEIGNRVLALAVVEAIYSVESGDKFTPLDGQKYIHINK